jgi:hypothetical protein
MEKWSQAGARLEQYNVEALLKQALKQTDNLKSILSILPFYFLFEL